MGINIFELGKGIERAKAAGKDPETIKKAVLKGLTEEIERTKMVESSKIKAEAKLKKAATAGTQAVTGFAKGALKGLGSTLAGASELGQRGLESFAGAVGLPQREVKRPEALQKILTPEGAAQKTGFTVEQIAEFFIPQGKLTKLPDIVKGAKVFGEAEKLRKAAVLSAKAAKEAAVFGGITAAQTGEFGEEAGIAAGIGAAFPVAGKVLSKIFSPLKSERLMSKALGLTKSQKTKLNQLAEQAGYNSVDDFATKAGLSGSRETMATQTDDLFNAAIASKKDLLKGIQGTVPNKYKDAFKYLKVIYNKPGQQKKLAEINFLAKKKDLSALELDRIRYLIDDTLPTVAYTGEEKVTVEGVQNLVDPIRETLAKLDKSGLLKKTNQEIRVLYKLMPALANSASSNVVNQILFRNMTRLFGLGGPATIFPGLQIPAVVAGITGAITDVPQISSGLAQILAKAGKFNVPGAAQGLKAGTVQGAPELQSFIQENLRR